jgi:hypothetical protein
MIIAIASGKGGTGKTTIATSLALSLAGQPGRAAPALIPTLTFSCTPFSKNDEKQAFWCLRLIIRSVRFVVNALRYASITPSPCWTEKLRFSLSFATAVAAAR